MKRILLLIPVLLVVVVSYAQQPIPAMDPPKRVLIFGATAHLGNGKVIEQSAIGLADGKIIFVMDSRGYKPAPSAFDTMIFADGKHVYPGMIAMGTQLGMREIELVRSTNDYVEAGSINPSARALIVYNTDSKVIPTVRTNGILLAQIVPQGGLLSGTSSVVSLDAWNWEDAAFKTDDGIWMNWPSMRIYRSEQPDAEQEQQKNYDKSIRDLTQFFNDAKAYYQLSNHETRNSHFEATRGLFDGTKKLYVRSEFARDIIAAGNFCKQYGISMVLVGGADSWRITGFLKENKIPVVIVKTHSLPSRDDDEVYAKYKLPDLLKKGGVDFAITDDEYWQQRNLPFEAGTAAAFGLSKEEALTSVTLSPAKIMGIDKQTGSIEEGKDATLFISTGDALDMRGNNVEIAFIKGKQISLDNVQLPLYHKYMKKYGFE